jgi:hypothetical protein
MNTHRSDSPPPTPVLRRGHVFQAQAVGLVRHTRSRRLRGALLAAGEKFDRMKDLDVAAASFTEHGLNLQGTPRIGTDNRLSAGFQDVCHLAFPQPIRHLR